ncbi:MAG TPA: diguanylate cyclase [Acidothermaceae bacterium]|nr:diguanylate cyclase [Acidothermaceae bacterium]
MRRLVGGWWFGRLVVALISVALIGGAALFLRSSQTAARVGVDSRFSSRAVLSAKFISTYTTELTAREQLVAASTLGGSDPTAAFAANIAAFGFQDGALLDSSGRALAVWPATPALIGQQYGAQFAPLRRALLGYVVVSNVEVADPTMPPLVGFAIPFNTASGRRVFSGAYLISSTPLAAFLNDSTTLKGAQLYLTDSAGVVFASNNTTQPTTAQTLTQLNPTLGLAATKTTTGTYRFASTPYSYIKTAVPGTPWSYVIAAPTTSVYATLNGSDHWLPWLILAGLSLLIAIAAWLTIRLLAGRRHLADLNTRLAFLARTDTLTGLSNRLHITEELEQLLIDARQQRFPVCVLMIDIDHFKDLNDTFGHRAGDFALRHVAHRLNTSLRHGDLLGRWGGEEFLAVLPDTDMTQGMVVAERVCNLVAGTPIEVGSDGGLVAIHTSVGIAEFADDTIDTLVDRADLGLYEAKAAGRNTVRAHAHAGSA